MNGKLSHHHGADTIEFHDGVWTFEKLVAAWLLEYASEQTRAAYLCDTRAWVRFCQRHDLEPWPPTRQQVAGYRAELESGSLSSATVARRITALSSLCEYAIDEELIGSNPCARVRRPRIKRDESRLVKLSTSQVRQIVAEADSDPRLWVSVAIRLMAAHGLRASEVLALTVSDIVEVDEMPALAFKRKGGKVATTPLPATTHRRIIELVNRHDGDQPLLAVSYRQLQYCVAGIGDRLELPRLHPHALRAAMITEALRAGVPLDRVQAAASHSDPRQTLKYDRRTNDLGETHPARIVSGLVAS